MTYADMITLLLCFFVIFLSVTITKKDIPKKVEAPPPVERSAPPPDILEGNLPLHGAPQAEEPSIMEGNLPFHEITIDEPEETAPATPANATLPEIVDHLKTQGNADIQQKGDHITTIQVNSAAFFGIGAAALSESGKSILLAVAANLKSDQFKDYQITVEGHTDDSPISTPQFPSNWELSTARASAVVHFFLQQNIPAQKLRAAGYADTFPIAPNRDANGNPIPANQAQNRRVVIKLEKIEKATVE
jgi:chemotaxis protein MotB